LPAAPESAVYFEDNGTNISYIDWDNDIIAVVKSIHEDDALNEFLARMLASINATP